MSKHRAGNIAKIGLTGALLVLLVRHIGVEQIGSSLGSVRVPFLAAAWLVVFTDSMLRSLSWKVLLTAKQIRLPYGHVLRSYLVGGFFGAFVPSSLGPDMTRTVLLSKGREVRPEQIAASILVLNLAGLWALCVLAALGGFWLLGTGPGAPEFVALLLPAGLGFALLFPVVVLAMPLLRDRPVPTGGRWYARVYGFLEALKSFAGARRHLAWAAGFAFLNHGLAVLLALVLATALDLQIAPMHFVVVLPLVLLARLLPLSIAGFGAEQGVFVYAFHSVGVPTADAFVLSLIFSATGLLFLGSVGGLYLLHTVFRSWRSVAPATGAGVAVTPKELAPPA